LTSGNIPSGSAQAARRSQAEHERIRGELEAAGFAITEILTANGQYLTMLGRDGDDLTPESRAACPGRGVFFRSYDLLTPVHYCAKPRAVRAQLPPPGPGPDGRR
jgi:hypothetical protein